LYFSSSLARSGSTWWQLMQQKVQKSRSTILPRSSASVSGPLLIQPMPPLKLGPPFWLYETWRTLGIPPGGPSGRRSRSSRVAWRPIRAETSPRAEIAAIAASGRRIREREKLIGDHRGGNPWASALGGAAPLKVEKKNRKMGPRVSRWYRHEDRTVLAPVRKHLRFPG